MIKPAICLAPLVAGLLACQLLMAETLRPEAGPEIAHLMRFVATSGCKFVRNGREHSAEEAVEHIDRKYDYYRKDIDTAEKFIEMAATRSMLSRKPYGIACPGQEIRASGDWLLQELERFRTRNAEVREP